MPQDYTQNFVADVGASAQMLGDDTYDALNPKGRRRSAPVSQVKPEDLLMTPNRRDRMDANALDVHRNMSLLGWMIRRTLDYCCLWDWHPMTQDDGLNERLRELMARDCEPEQLDYLGRMSWDDHRRIAESLKITGGDCFTIPLQERTLQLVEGPYCRDPRDKKTGRWLNGAKLNGRDRIVAWNFREMNLEGNFGTQWKDRQVPAFKVWQHCQYERRPNMIRPVSPIVSSLNEMRDLYETLDLARAKIKLEQLFGIAIFRQPGDDDDLADSVDEDGNEEDEDESTKERHLDFGSGPVVMDRTVGESVEILQANSPGSNTIEFLRLCIQLVLLGLDLPANFYNPSETNFFGSRAAWNLYERSCHARRQSQLRLHHRMTRWRLWQWIMPVDMGGTGEIVLPRGMTIEDLRYRWIPRGVPWWKPQEELHTGLAAVAAGLKTFQGLCDETGNGLWTENMKAIAREREFAQKMGFDLTFNPARLEVTMNAQGTKPKATSSTATAKDAAP